MQNAADALKERAEGGVDGVDLEREASADWVDTIGLVDKVSPPMPADWIDTIPMSLSPNRARRR